MNKIGNLVKQALLMVFKAYYCEDLNAIDYNKIDKTALKKGVVIFNDAPKSVVKAAIKLYGIDNALLSNTFHKTWDKILNATDEQLVEEQLIHYFSTYGLEAFGLTANSVIPNENCKMQKFDYENSNLTIIKPMDQKQIINAMLELLNSGIALSQSTITHIENLACVFDLRNYIETIENREVKTSLYIIYKLVPENPEEFLRYLIYRLTGKSLLIKSKDSITSLKKEARSNYDETQDLLSTYIRLFGEDKLSSIFLRFKPLFLALKTEANSFSETNRIINRLRKKADKNKTAFKTPILERLSSLENFDEKTMLKINADIKVATTFKLIKIYNMFNYRLNNENDPIIYRIRNNKSFVCENFNKIKNKDMATNIKQKILNEIVERVKENVGNKTVFIPTNLTYALPTSEKQFLDNIPCGSTFEIENVNSDINTDSFKIGVSWYNIKRKKETEEIRVDLDLSLFNASQYFGWCNLENSYRRINDTDMKVAFSGDMTDAKNGATEIMALAPGKKEETFLVALNLYNDILFSNDVLKIPFNLFFAVSEKCNFNKINKDELNLKTFNGLVNPNNIVMKFNLEITDNRQEIIFGIAKLTPDKKLIYTFDNTSFSNFERVPKSDINTDFFIKGLEKMAQSKLTLNTVLELANIKTIKTDDVVKYQKKMMSQQNSETNPDDLITDYIDLTINNIDKTSLIELLK